MRSGAVFGYRGLVSEIIARIKAERFSGKKVHTVATGGYATLLARKLPEVEARIAQATAAREALLALSRCACASFEECVGAGG